MYIDIDIAIATAIDCTIVQFLKVKIKNVYCLLYISACTFVFFLQFSS